VRALDDQKPTTRALATMRVVMSQTTACEWTDNIAQTNHQRLPPSSFFFFFFFFFLFSFHRREMRRLYRDSAGAACRTRTESDEELVAVSPCSLRTNALVHDAALSCNREPGEPTAVAPGLRRTCAGQGRNRSDGPNSSGRVTAMAMRTPLLDALGGMSGGARTRGCGRLLLQRGQRPSPTTVAGPADQHSLGGYCAAAGCDCRTSRPSCKRRDVGRAKAGSFFGSKGQVWSDFRCLATAPRLSNSNPSHGRRPLQRSAVNANGKSDHLNGEPSDQPKRSRRRPQCGGMSSSSSSKPVA